LLKRNKKNKPRLPTVEEFLQLVPLRQDFEWSTNADGLVELKVPKFKSNFGKSFCKKVIRKEDVFIANMDKIGSIVWANCDGLHNVKQILEKLKKEFPDEKDIDQRLFLFLRQMQSLNYIDLLKKTN
jgi:hypothetical protein